jgi:hypothetical protein
LVLPQPPANGLPKVVLAVANVVVPVVTVSAVSAPTAPESVAVPVFRVWTRLAMAGGPQAAVIKGVISVMRCLLPYCYG